MALGGPVEKVVATCALNVYDVLGVRDTTTHVTAEVVDQIQGLAVERTELPLSIWNTGEIPMPVVEYADEATNDSVTVETPVLTTVVVVVTLSNVVTNGT